MQLYIPEVQCNFILSFLFLILDLHNWMHQLDMYTLQISLWLEFQFLESKDWNFEREKKNKNSNFFYEKVVIKNWKINGWILIIKKRRKDSLWSFPWLFKTKKSGTNQLSLFRRNLFNLAFKKSFWPTFDCVECPKFLYKLLGRWLKLVIMM